MATTRTFQQVKDAFQSAAGLTAMEKDDNWFFKSSLNRAAFKAWSESEIWPRYSVPLEERCQIDNTVPYTETGLNTIGEFLRIYTSNPHSNNSTAVECEFYVDTSGATIVNPPSILTDTVFVSYKKEWDGPYDEDSTAIPEEFVDYIIYAVLADFYQGDGQDEKSIRAEQRADLYLAKQLGRLSYTNRNPYRFGTIKTHTKNQSRYY